MLIVWATKFLNFNGSFKTTDSLNKQAKHKQGSFPLMSGDISNILKGFDIISLSFTIEIINVLGNTYFVILYYSISNKFSNYSI